MSTPARNDGRSDTPVAFLLIGAIFVGEPLYWLAYYWDRWAKNDYVNIMVLGGVLTLPLACVLIALHPRSWDSEESLGAVWRKRLSFIIGLGLGIWTEVYLHPFSTLSDLGNRIFG